jgi:hypothetical protein
MTPRSKWNKQRSVMPAHSRSKNGVASLAYVAGIHVLM